jgi:hypothetical protein
LFALLLILLHPVGTERKTPELVRGKNRRDRFRRRELWRIFMHESDLEGVDQFRVG